MVSMTAGGTTRTPERRYVRDRIGAEAAALVERGVIRDADAAERAT
jgi:hypothetical protein